MRRLFFFLLIVVALSSCRNSGNGELIGVQGREPFFQPDPFGMVFVPAGSYTMGAGDQDVPYALIYQPKTVTLQAFYMDETEITNNEYRQFVFWVRDSIAMRLLGEQTPEDYFISENDFGEPFDPPFLNWRSRIDYGDQASREVLNEMYLPEHERFYRVKQFDTRKFNYEFYWIDLKAAARKDFATPGNNEAGSLNNRPQGLKDRSVYIRKEVINVYPDTLAWVHDYTYSFNEPMTEKYFWHPAYDNYPVVGVSWKQARAFCIWRSNLLHSYNVQREDVIVNEFRLPNEVEWEWAARGGLQLSPYPWGGPYIRNTEGCFLGNYKPLRGNYIDDGGIQTVIVAHYAPNDFGLYDMSGNVSEWCFDAFDESAYNFTWDMNSVYDYNAKDTDPPALKRKIIRGGSWKDIGYYIQVNARSYEFQDTAKCYIGFRCVQTYLGRQKDDNPNTSSNIYN
ncbi:MAG: SUMF1/EgtB/PvdO family nonheme iron enzyme [Bacteroidetes bacterium]|nr:SUMF1/EgtB/PvdO family nonheme iron enzyme [Bacteroidota bacterium]